MPGAGAKPSGVWLMGALRSMGCAVGHCEAGEANRWVVFEIRSVEIAGPLENGKEASARVMGILTIKGKPIETVADAQVTYLTLTPEQLETQKRFGFTSDNLKIRARFTTTFTNHGMQVPQLLILKVSNDILLEADLVLVLAL